MPLSDPLIGRYVHAHGPGPGRDRLLGQAGLQRAVIRSISDAG